MTWGQLATLWWIAMAVGFGWRMGNGLAAHVLRALRRRIRLPAKRDDWPKGDVL